MGEQHRIRLAQQSDAAAVHRLLFETRLSDTDDGDSPPDPMDEEHTSAGQRRSGPAEMDRGKPVSPRHPRRYRMRPSDLDDGAGVENGVFRMLHDAKFRG